MRLVRSNQAVVACPRVMRPGLEDVRCEADILATVGGSAKEGTWLDDYDAPCFHTLTAEEEALVLDAAIEDLDLRMRDRLADSWRDL